MNADDPRPTDVPLVEEYLEEWLDWQRTQVQPSSWSSYRGNVDRYLVPHLGGLRLDEITVERLNRLYGALLTRGGFKGSGYAGVPCWRRGIARETPSTARTSR